MIFKFKIFIQIINFQIIPQIHKLKIDLIKVTFKTLTRNIITKIIKRNFIKMNLFNITMIMTE